jgi:hypothetical protein
MQITIELDYREAYNSQLNAQSIEAVVIAKIKLFNPFLIYKTGEPRFEILERYSDIELWWLVTQTYPDKWRERSDELLQKSKQNTLSQEERTENEQLQEEYGLRMLFRSRMLVMLKARGYDIDWYLDRQLYN